MKDDRIPTTDHPPPSEMVPDTSQRDQVVMTQLLDILASERRRNILSYLMRYSEKTISREEIVNALPDCEANEAGPVTQRECLEIDLHHVHLPKLANSSLIEYDPTSGAVEYRASADVERFISKCLTFEKTEL